jgi:membrane-associated phospholipid phosphatase
MRGLGAILVVLAAVLAAGRVLLGVHYPSDVLAGAALGTAAALVLSHPRVRSRLDDVTDAAGRRAAALGTLLRGRTAAR